MAIPFLHYFQKSSKAETAKAAVAPPPPPPPLEKPSSERLSKTVMPSSARSVAPQETAQPVDSKVVAPNSYNPSPAAVAAPTITPKAGQRTVSFGAPLPSSPAPRAGLPPAVALALEPKVERVISLELGEIVPHIPDGFLNAIETLDTSRRVLLKAAEVEKGMSNGKPTISLASIHDQVPEVFARPVTSEDAPHVQLPFAKVLEEFTKLQVRSDQVRHTAVPQVETPFLKVTQEDNERFGTTTEELETGDLPPVMVQAPTAEAFAAAEPEPAFEAKLQPLVQTKISFNNPPPAPANGSAPAAAPAAPTRIPFKLAPNGTDVPANESVPASGGPSGPSLSPATPAPTRIPFKLAPSTEETSAKPDQWLTAESIGTAPKEAPLPTPPAKGEVRIRLELKAVLQALPAFQAGGDASTVPADVKMELPFALVEPQLATGRVSVTPAAFAAGIPETYRSLFKADGATDVSLPLQEVLKNLPAASLRMRDDQVEQEVGGKFATPFSTKAEEDAKRFNVASAPIAKPTVEIPPTVEVAPAVEALKAPASEPPKPEAEKPAASDAIRSPLQVALDTDEKLDAKGVVAHLNRMAGVKASAIVFSDGLSLAGDLPSDLEVDGLCAMAPALIQRIDSHMAETKLGALRGMTLACSKGAMTFFMRENLCLAALHSNGEIPADVRERLGRVLHELSRKYSHPI